MAFLMRLMPKIARKVPGRMALATLGSTGPQNSRNRLFSIRDCRNFQSKTWTRAKLVNHSSVFSDDIAINFIKLLDFFSVQGIQSHCSYLKASFFDGVDDFPRSMKK